MEDAPPSKHARRKQEPQWQVFRNDWTISRNHSNPELYKSFASALDRFNDEPDYRLPMPARYIIDKSGIIRAADVNADYKIRPELSETLSQLRRLSAAAAD